MQHGGKRTGAGRKSKADEVLLIERLSPLDDVALKALEKGVRGGDFQFVKLFMEYRYGKPNEKVDITTGGKTITGYSVEVIRPHANAEVAN